MNLVLLATTLSIANAVCSTACKYEYASDGFYEPKEKACACVSYLDYESVLGKKSPRLPNKPEPRETQDGWGGWKSLKDVD